MMLCKEDARLSQEIPLPKSARATQTKAREKDFAARGAAAMTPRPILPLVFVEGRRLRRPQEAWTLTQKFTGLGWTCGARQ